jgi:hypothetical protein
MAVCKKTGKIAHKSRKQAHGHIEFLTRQGRGNPDYSVYACVDHFHIGHSKIALDKRIRASLSKRDR